MVDHLGNNWAVHHPQEGEEYGQKNPALDQRDPNRGQIRIL